MAEEIKLFRFNEYRKMLSESELTVENMVNEIFGGDMTKARKQIKSQLEELSKKEQEIRDAKKSELIKIENQHPANMPKDELGDEPDAEQKQEEEYNKLKKANEDRYDAVLDKIKEARAQLNDKLESMKGK